MKTPIDTGFIHDLSQLDTLRQKASNPKESDEALFEAAKQFEAIFTQMLFKSMRDANEAFESDLVDNRTSKFYRQMADEQLSSALSREGSLGLAELIVQQFKIPEKNEIRDENLGMLDPPRQSILPSMAPLSVLSPQGERKPKEGVDALFLPNKHASPEITKKVNIHHEGRLEKENDKTGSSKPFESPSDFVSRLLPYAKKAARALGTDPGILIAQAALETGWGKKVIGNARGSSHNLFNIKADPAWKGNKVAVQTLEFHKDIPVQELASFRSYGAFDESFNDYVHFIHSNPRYSKALEASEKPDLYIQGLQNAGYATDPEYSNKVMSVFHRVKNLMTP